MKLSFEDLKPAEATFELSTRPGKPITLRVFSLAERIWVNQRFGRDKIEHIFETQSLPEIAEIAHHLLKDKTEFPDFMTFAGAVVTIKDQIAITQALLATIGIDDKLIKELSKNQGDKKGNAEAPLT